MSRYFTVSPHFFRLALDALEEKHITTSIKFLRHLFCNHIIERGTNEFCINANELSAKFEVPRFFITGVMGHFLSRDLFRLKEVNKKHKKYTMMLNPLFFQNEIEPSTRESLKVYKKLPFVKKIREITANNSAFSVSIAKKLIPHGAPPNLIEFEEDFDGAA